VRKRGGKEGTRCFQRRDLSEGSSSSFQQFVLIQPFYHLAPLTFPHIETLPKRGIERNKAALCVWGRGVCGWVDEWVGVYEGRVNM